MVPERLLAENVRISEKIKLYSKDGEGFNTEAG